MKKSFMILTWFAIGLGISLTPGLIAAQSTAEPIEVIEYVPKDLPFDPSSINADPTMSSITVLDLGKRDPVSVTIAIVNVVLTLLGLGFLILLLYAGFIWIWAKGNEEDIGKAKTIIKRSVLGLIIILATYGISYLTFYLVNTYATKK